MLFDEEKAKKTLFEFLRAVFPQESEGQLLIWTLPKKDSRWFTTAEFAEAADYAVARAAEADVYFGLGLRKEALLNGRGKSEDVCLIAGAWADIDILGPTHMSQDLPPSLEVALETLAEFPMKPSLIVGSGHGIQPYWLFKEPWTLRTDQDRKRAEEFLKRFQATLRQAFRRHGFDVDSVVDLARVLRLPGTINRKAEPVQVRLIGGHSS
jgi:putative DNA primase/helicase